MFDDFIWAPLVPELLVTNLNTSLKFWSELCGFKILYYRPEENFAYLELHGAQVMLEETGLDRNWITGPLKAPLGRGINLQIEVPAIEAIIVKLKAANWPLFMAPEEKWYRVDGVETGQEQFLVQDPDGYLLRFIHDLGRRTLLIT